jgi:hypothetical protein
MHKYPEIEQTYVLEGSLYDHDGMPRRRVRVAASGLVPRDALR